MFRALMAIFSIVVLLGACTQRTICPAYQSAFIHDKDELRKKFSYFKEDSTPKVLTASKNKFLVAEPVSYQRKVRNLQTVVMKPVPVHVPDSIANPDSVTMKDFERAAKSVYDTTFIIDTPRDSVKAPATDSVYVITKDKELRLLKYNAPDSLVYDSALNKYIAQVPQYYVADVKYNLDQDNYMWYLRDVLVLPDAKIAMSNKGGDKKSAEETGEKRKGGFFKNLFRKKQTEPQDTTSQVAPAEQVEEFDFIDQPDSTSQAEVPQPGQQKEQKKGLFGRKKKKVDPAKPQKNQPKADPKKDESDGF